MQTPETVEETQARRRQRTIVIVIAVVALCCSCLTVAVALYSWSALRGGEKQEFPASEFPSVATQEVMTAPPSSNSPVPDTGEAPAGGLGNEVLRNDTWRAVSAAAMGQGCDLPMAADSAIEVLQEPDAAGVWVEQWTVACQSGESYPFEVEFLLDDTGATFDIRSLP
jgi:hypothetical protein